jgi:hypothetical protein
LKSGAVTSIESSIGGSASGRQFARWSAVHRADDIVVVDMADSCIAGTLSTMPVLIDADGTALVPASFDRWQPHGPLRWVRPSPASRESP